MTIQRRARGNLCRFHIIKWIGDVEVDSEQTYLSYDTIQNAVAHVNSKISAFNAFELSAYQINRGSGPIPRWKLERIDWNPSKPEQETEKFRHPNGLLI